MKIKTIKKDSKNVIAQLENQGWFQCTSYNDPTPFKEVVKKTNLPGVSFSPGLPSTLAMISAETELLSLPSAGQKVIAPMASSSCRIVFPLRVLSLDLLIISLGGEPAEAIPAEICIEY